MPDYLFWNDRWINNQIGFHLSAPHSSLIEFCGQFSGHKKVFVPLCGKSLDMIFLRKLGLEVIGIEFQEMAIRDFMKENNLNLKMSEAYGLKLFQGEGFTLYQGDLFQLKESALVGVTCCYDRASMVAFNEQERIKYSQFLINTATEVTTILAPLLDFGDIAEAGPPFSVTAPELQKLFGKSFDLSVLKSSDIELRDTFLARGAPYEKEVTWLFKRKL